MAMNSAGDLTPTPMPAAGRSWLARHRILLVPAGGALAIGAVTAAALLLLAKPANTVEKMVPVSAQIAGFAYLDPSLTQKVNLLRIAHRFPDYQTDKAINTRLDDAFKAAGLSFSGDVQPWLGSEVAFAAQLGEGKTADSPAALFIASRDDAKAVATLARLRVGTWGKTMQWRDEQYGGVGVAVGSPASTGARGGAYAYVDHDVVIAASDTLIKEIIDTGPGTQKPVGRLQRLRRDHRVVAERSARSRVCERAVAGRQRQEPGLEDRGRPRSFG